MIKYVTRLQNSERVRNPGESITDDHISVNSYFDIETDDDIVVIGGGIFTEQIYKDNADQKVVCWGVGTNSDDINGINQVKTGSHAFSWRDKSVVSDEDWVPCPSCFNTEFINEPTGNNMLWVVTNTEHMRPPMDQSAVFLNTPKEQFLREWNQSEIIVSNSYHSLYWALLSGRAVIPFGYNLKFKYLFENFGLTFPESNMYESNRAGAKEIADLDMEPFSVSSSYLEEFKERNLEFADKLNDLGIKATQR